jgi:tungstate transport system substrate-binding protein
MAGRFTRNLVPLALSALVARGAQAQGGPPSRDVILATTTSLQETGLLDTLTPLFRAATGYTLRPVAVGSGQALKMGERGDADVVLAHAPEAEAAFMAAGHGTRRRVVAWNYFTIVGPPDDPAGVRRAPTSAAALAAIATAGAVFVSRGDSSGTHQRELALWRAAGGKPVWRGYLETGQGMSATLLVADERRGYALTDLATYGALRRRLDLVALRGEEPELRNVYHVIELNPAGHPRMNTDGGRAFADFMTSPAVQDLLADFGRARTGAPLFVPARGSEPGR